VACDHLDLLRDLPVVLAAIFLRAVIDFDVRFPRERAAIESRFAFLEALPTSERRGLTKGFYDLSLPPELVSEDWVRFPQTFEEDLNAHLWASHQLDTFRAIATNFAAAMDRASQAKQPDIPRWGVVVLGTELRYEGYALFRKLRPHGVFFPQVDAQGGMATILDELASRASGTKISYGHWYIDGGTPQPHRSDELCHFSWEGSSALRSEVLKKAQTIIESGSGGPEMLRSVMATWRPETGSAITGDVLVDRLVLDIYGEGSGTQIFSTTFVQWAAREILRRAEPASIVARFGLRQKERTLNEMISTGPSEVSFDVAGSLVDADFGAYTTWINLNRLAGSEHTKFIAFSEAHGQAVAIGPGRPRGTEAPDRIAVSQLLAF
jgi:hypothetical protein